MPAGYRKTAEFEILERRSDDGSPARRKVRVDRYRLREVRVTYPIERL